MSSIEKLKKFQKQLPYLWKTIRLIWDAAPGWSSAWILLLILQGMLPVTVVYLTRSIVDRLVSVRDAGATWHGFQPLFMPVLMIVTVLLFMAVIHSLLNIVRTAQSLLVEEKINAMVQEKSVSLDLSFYESSEYFDKLFRARNDAMQRPLELVGSLGSFLQNTITLAAMAFVLGQYGLWAPVALFFSTLPVLYVVLDHRSRQYHWRLKNTRLERRAWYYDWLISSRENASEIRIFCIGDHFIELFRLIKERLRRESIRMMKSEAMAELISALFALLLTGVAMGWMVWRVAAGAFSLGDLAMFYQAFNQGQQLLRSLLRSVGQMYGSSLFLGDFFDFLTLKSIVVNPDAPVTLPDTINKAIRFEKVGFRYPFMKNKILDGFNLEIKSGKITAIVGVNGAGKSTLVKLLGRLYDPECGRITFDGVDIRQADLAGVRRMVTVLFQEPVRYNMTVAENIRLGNMSAGNDTTEIMEAARAAGADQLIARLPDGADTLLGRWFPEGTDLSGGEWQRLALARAFMRKSPIIVLDEPTRGMDSWGELDWLYKFRELSQGRTALVITHRFTTAMQADIIHVMDEGRIIETGTHRELLKVNGRYASSWTRQMGREEMQHTIDS